MVLEKINQDFTKNQLYIRIFLYITLTIFSVITIYYYLGNPLNIFHYFGLKMIILSLFITFIFIGLILYYTVFYDDNNYFFTSKNFFEIVYLFGINYVFYFFISLIGFYLFSKLFSYLQNKRELTKTITNLLYYGIFILSFYLLYSGFKYFFSGKKNSTFPFNDFSKLIKEIILTFTCFLKDIYNFLINDVHNTNPIFLVIFLVIIIIFSFFYIIPKILIYIILYNGKQLLNEPIYLNNSTYLTNYEDLNKDITNTNIFRYISQQIYDFYDSTFNPNYTSESYVNLGDPSLNYTLNKNIEEIQKNIDPKRLEEMISENPDLKDSIKKMVNNPDFLKEQLLSISPYKGEIIDNIFDLLDGSKIVTTDKTIYEASNPTISYNFNTIKDKNYNYSISCWVFIDNYDGNKNGETNKSIIKFGNKLNMLFNPYEKEIILKVDSCNDSIDKKNCKTKIAFRTKNILFQRWNNFIFNYDSGTLDVFVNNRLISSTPNISPLINNDSITVGDNNGVEGAICNVMYFSTILTKQDINKLYSFFYVSNPPIL
jgi:hypothetical protein